MEYIKPQDIMRELHLPGKTKQQLADAIALCEEREKRSTHEGGEFLLKANSSFVIVNIWFANLSPLEAGHVGLITLENNVGSQGAKRLSFWPKDVCSISGIINGEGEFKEILTADFATFPRIIEENRHRPIKNYKTNKSGLIPDRSVVFCSLDVNQINNAISRMPNQTYRYHLFASCNFWFWGNNCITMAQSALNANDGFQNLLADYQKNCRSAGDQIRDWLPTVGCVIGALWFFNKLSSDPNSFQSAGPALRSLSKLLFFSLMGYAAGRGLGSYFHEIKEKRTPTERAKGIITCLPAVANIFWHGIPHISKDWLVTTPGDFLSKVKAAQIAEAKRTTDYAEKARNIMMWQNEYHNTVIATEAKAVYTSISKKI